jgi:hypothetical protein
LSRSIVKKLPKLFGEERSEPMDARGVHLRGGREQGASEDGIHVVVRRGAFRAGARIPRLDDGFCVSRKKLPMSQDLADGELQRVHRV